MTDPLPVGPPVTFWHTLSAIKSVQKTTHGASAYLTLINRPLGSVAAAIAYKFHITPNALSVFGGLITYAACAALALLGIDQVWTAVAAAFLLIGYALDSADGQLARLMGSTSLSGEFLDRCIDFGKTVFIHAAIIFVLLGSPTINSTLVALVGTLFLASSIVHSFGSIIRKEMWRRQPSDEIISNPTHSPGGVVKSILYLGKEYGVLCASVSLIWITDFYFILYSILGLTTFLLSGVFLVKWFKELRTIDRRMVKGR